MHIRNERTLNAWLVGAETSRGELCAVLSRAGLELAERVDLPGSNDGAALVCIALDHPDQFGSDEIRRFLGAFAARIVCVRSAWCRSMGRSRSDWPAAVVVDRAEFEQRVARELQVLNGERPPLPLTAGLEEIAAFSHRDSTPLSGHGRTAKVVSPDRAYRETIRAQLCEAGFRMQDADGDVCVIDVDPVERAGSELKVPETCGAATSIVLLTEDPGSVVPPETGARWIVASKFAPVGEWLERIAVAVLLAGAVLAAGCRQQPSSVPAAGSTSQPGWAEQVEAVRRGDQSKISVTSAVSDSQWQDLSAGCEALQVLEIEGGAPQQADFKVLSGLPKLRRLRLGGDFSDASASVLGDHPSITELIVSSESLTDAGVQSLCRLPLVQLRLRAPLVSDAGIASIGELKQLRFLHLIDVPLTDAALPALARLSALESLYLDRAKCTDDGLSALLKERPDLHFHRDQMHLRDDPKKHKH